MGVCYFDLYSIVQAGYGSLIMKLWFCYVNMFAYRTFNGTKNGTNDINGPYYYTHWIIVSSGKTAVVGLTFCRTGRPKLPITSQGHCRRRSLSLVSQTELIHQICLWCQWPSLFGQQLHCVASAMITISPTQYVHLFPTMVTVGSSVDFVW